jgi:hypothetical protein
MKAFFKFFLMQVALVLVFSASSFSSPNRSGFFIPDSITSVSFNYKVVDNLIILPVTINDSVEVNLILDTGCRNLVLFGKRFQKLFQFQPGKQVQFSGLGSGDPVFGKLSLNNRVSINAVIGQDIPVVVVPQQNLFGSYIKAHGVIGYDIFAKFEVEINPVERIITFRPALHANLSSEYTSVPIRVEDSRPLIDCQVVFTKGQTYLCDLMIDTGSILGLLLKTTDLNSYGEAGPNTVLGRGFNGPIEGIRTSTEKLVLKDLTIRSISTGIIHSPWHNYASIGMDILRKYSLVLNYCKGYAGFKRV